MVTGLIVVITEYYTGTGKRPVVSIAQASVTGHGTNVIQGLAVSLESTALPALVIVAGIISTYQLAGLFGTAIAVTTMLGLAGMIVALDAFGPVTDNAGGIAEMAGLPKEVRQSTDALDAVGNTTKAVTKGYAIGSAGLGALVLFAAYTNDIRHFTRDRRALFQGRRRRRLRPLQPLCRRRPHLRRPHPLSLRRHRDDRGRPRGGLGGARSAPAVQGNAGHHERHAAPRLRPRRRHADQGGDPGDDRSLAAAGAGAVRRLFRRAVDLGLEGSAFAALGASLLGVIVNGLFVAISMTSGGGAWDNAKKSFEDGFVDKDGVKWLKGSEAHKAAVTGDTVGDPYKDTAGPAVNPAIKITNIVALLLLAILAR